MAARIALYKLSRRPFFRPGFGRGVAEIVRLIHDEAAEFILIGMFFLRRLFLFRFEVPTQIAGFDPIGQAVPSTTVPIAGYMVAADPLRVGQQETRERFTINAVLPDFFALKIMRSRDTMNRTFKRRMGQLLQAMFKRDFPGDIEGRAHQPRTKLIRGLARHTDSSCCIGDGCCPRQRRQKGAHLLTSPLVVPFRAGGGCTMFTSRLRRCGFGGAGFWFRVAHSATYHTSGRSDERRLGKACGSTCRSWWQPYQ